MTIFGIIWILLLFYCFSSVNRMISLTIVSAVFQCSNVLVIGDSGIGPQIITSIVCIIRICLSKKIEMEKLFKMESWIKCMFLLISIVILSSAINKTINNGLLKILQLFIYFLCFVLIYYSHNTIEEDTLYLLIRRLTIALIIIGFIQVLITSGILPRLSIINTLLYNDTGKYVYFYRDNYHRILSTFMEPSYYATYVVGAFYYFISIKEKRNENKLLISLLLIQIIFTFSSSAYGALAISGFLFYISSKERGVKFKMISYAIIGFIIMYFCFYDVLDSVIFSKNLSESNMARRAWNKAALKMYELSPVIGNGYKSSRASNVLLTLLAETGIIGLVSYIMTNFIIMLGLFRKKSKDNKQQHESYKSAIIMAIMSAVFTQIIAVPDLDICTYWMWLNIFAVQLSFQRRKEG